MKTGTLRHEHKHKPRTSRTRSLPANSLTQGAPTYTDKAITGPSDTQQSLIMGIRETSEEQKLQFKQLNLDPTLVEVFSNATVSPIVQFYIFTNIAGRNVDLFGTENLVISISVLLTMIAVSIPGSA